MKDLINNWENSDKYKEFKLKLEKKKKENIQDILDLKINIKTMEKEQYILSKDELIQFIDSILILDESSMDDVDWINEVLCAKMTKEELFADFIKTIITWYMYLSVYELQEEFEICSNIIKVIRIERCDFISILKAKFGEFTDEDKIYIEDIINFYKENK